MSTCATPSKELHDASVLLTSTGGFVGSRLVERLVFEDKARVVGAGRTLDHPDKLDAAGVTLARAGDRAVEQNVSLGLTADASRGTAQVAVVAVKARRRGNAA